MFEQSTVGRRGCMMEFVDDDDVEGLGIDLAEILLGQTLHGCKHVSPLIRPMAINIELSKGSVTQDLAKCAEALTKNLLSMSDEQQARIAHLLPQPFEIQRRHDRLPGAGGGHD